MLKKNSHFKPNTICRILTDDKARKDELPTRLNILGAMKWLVDGATSNSRLFFQYSGHGSNVRDKNGDEADGKDETICPLDGNIIDDDIRKILVDSLPEGCVLYFLCDSCRSQSICDLKYRYSISFKGDNVEYKIVPDGKYKDSKCQVVCISGCEDAFFSADCKINGRYCGALTNSFLTTLNDLKSKGKEPRFKDIMKGILKLLKAGGYDQNPQISTGRWMDLGEKMW
jgi:hypothetical protein